MAYYEDKIMNDFVKADEPINYVGNLDNNLGATAESLQNLKTFIRIYNWRRFWPYR